MLRVRRLFRRIARPFAFAAVAGIVSVSLIVTTPSNAQAFADGGLISAPVIAGAVEAVSGTVVTAAVVSNPIGWTVAAVVGIGIGLYATKDFWIQFNPGQLFVNNNGITNPGPGGVVDPRVSITSFTQLDNATVRVAIATTAPPAGTPDTYYTVSAHLKCNPQANGSGTPYADTIVAPWSYYKPTFGRTQQFDIKCPYGYVIGAIVGPAGGDPLLTASGPGGGPTKVMRWGTLIQNGMSGDPRGATTHYTVSAECISDNGQLGTVTAATDGNAAVQGDKGAVKVPSCAAAGKGHNTGKMHIDAFNDLDGTTTRVWETNAPTVDPNEPLCDPTKPGAGCKLEISIDGKPCTIGNLECEHWTQVDQADSTHTRVSCKHGPYAVALAVCAPLEGAYYPGGRTATQANTDGDPNTSDNTDFKGSPLPNNPAPQTLPGTGTTTGTTPAPGDAGQTSPSADSNSQECFPTGWGMFNPVEWVLKPLGCAFIPKTSQQTALQTRMQNITNTAVASPPFSWVAGIGMSAPHTAACPDWNIAIAGHSWNVVCDSSFTAALRGSRVAIFAMMATAMVWPLIRSIWYASIPFLRVAPGNHK